MNRINLQKAAYWSLPLLLVLGSITLVAWDITLTQKPIIMRGAAENKKAIIIAADNYSHWRKLQFAVREAHLLQGILEEKYGYQVTTLLNKAASQKNIVSTLDAKLANASKQDSILIFFAGHGYWDVARKEGYFIPAEAQETSNGYPCTAEWIWNTQISKLMDASPARHILLVANSCYSASLLEPSVITTQESYEEANRYTSRMVISSGEGPVLDSALFTQAIVKYLGNNQRDIIPASELAQALLPIIHNASGGKQTLRFGKIPLPSHKGGEFLFVKKDIPQPDITFSKVTTSISQNTPYDIAEMISGNFRETASNMAKQSDRQTIESLKIILSEEKDETTRLLDRIAEIELHPERLQDIAQPRVAILLPPNVENLSPDTQIMANIYHEYIFQILNQRPEIIMVSRELLNNALDELNISVSGLSDPKYLLEHKKLRPARFLIQSKWIKGLDAGKPLCFFHIFETETGMDHSLKENLSDLSKNTDEILKISKKVSENIVRKITLLHPLEAKVIDMEENILKAGIGKIHNIQPDQEFALLTRKHTPDGLQGEYEDKTLGQVTPKIIGEIRSSFLFPKTNTLPPDAEFWIKEL